MCRHNAKIAQASCRAVLRRTSGQVQNSPGVPEASYDIAIVGGGPGGYVAALRATQLGARVAVVERDRVGGTCLIRGCIPTKALLQSAELYSLTKQGAELGIIASKLGFDWSAAQSRKAQVVEQLVSGVEGLLKRAGVDNIKGQARLT